MMKKLMMSVGALAVAATMATAPAQAGYGGGVYFSNKHLHVTFYGNGCYKYKKRALRAEYRGDWYKAEYWWDKYWACKSGY